jgi:hypothetical protein
MSSIFLSKLGYLKVTDLVKESISSKTPFLKTVIRQGLLTESEIQTALLAATKGTSDTR